MALLKHILPQQAPYAEDQPLARTLLTTHVTHRTLQSGALLALPTGLAATSISAYRSTPRIPLTRSLLLASLPRSVGLGALVGLGLGVPMTLGAMRGKEEIEWQDRAWRLLGNAGQREVDGWSVAGSLAGGVLAARRGGMVGVGVARRAVEIVGGAAMGNLAGVGGYLGWRYGVKGGKRED